MRTNQPFSSCNLEFIVIDAGRKYSEPCEALIKQEVVSVATGSEYNDGTPMMQHSLHLTYKRGEDQVISRIYDGVNWKIRSDVIGAL